MSEDRERVLHETEGEDTEPDVEAHKLSFNRDEAEKTMADRDEEDKEGRERSHGGND